MKIEQFDSKGFCGYDQISTFYEDFSIAEKFGLSAIRDTYNRAVKNWHTDYKMITELCMVVNWKSWRWAEHNAEYCDWYVETYYKLRNWCLDHLKGEELSYFLRVTD